VSASDFLGQWDRHFAEWCTEGLMPDGAEAALLAPVAACREAALQLVAHAADAEDYRQRKAAAILAGFIHHAPPEVLDELFERESERAALAAPDTSEPLYSQSVVEDVVLAAARWCRQPALRPGGLGLLRKIVERTLVGEYWSTASYAIATLCRYDAPGSEELLESFARFAAGSPPVHPANPTLSTEREFARRLLAGQREALDSVEAILQRQEEAGHEVHFEPDTERAVAAWLRLAQGL
jgi:hypothetical protein